MSYRKRSRRVRRKSRRKSRRTRTKKSKSKKSRRKSRKRSRSKRRSRKLRRGRPRDLRKFKAERGCSLQSTKKYVSRSSPPYPANLCRNREIIGNDGKMYKSVRAHRGGKAYYKWKKL